MRVAFAHDATLLMPPDADARAPGAAVTVALCGDWEHEPPCPLAAHHTSATRHGDELRLHILFATEPDAEETVRRHIDAALAAGELHGPEGAVTHWTLQDSGPGELSEAERDHGDRLASG